MSSIYQLNKSLWPIVIKKKKEKDKKKEEEEEGFYLRNV